MIFYSHNLSKVERNGTYYKTIQFNINKTNLLTGLTNKRL